MSLIDRGILTGLISFDEDRKFITYIHQNKKRNFTNPEEQVQAETFCALVLQYSGVRTIMVSPNMPLSCSPVNPVDLSPLFTA